MSGMDDIEQQAADSGFLKVRYAGSHDVGWKITCSACGETSEHHWGPRTSPDLMTKNMRVKGWICGHKMRAFCPRCRSSAKALPQTAMAAALRPAAPITTIIRETGMRTASDTMQAEQVRVTASPTRQELQQSARKVEKFMEQTIHKMEKGLKQAKKVMALLDLRFDEKTRMYEKGWNDKRVAKELELSEEYVAEVRLECYGEIAEDPQIMRFRDDMAALQAEVDSTLSKFAELESKRVNLLTRFEDWVAKRRGPQL